MIKIDDIPLAEPGGPVVMLDPDVYNALVMAVRAFSNLKAAPGSGLRVLHNEDGIVIEGEPE